MARRIFQVILPNIRFGLVSAFFLTFVLSWEEIAVTIFITSVDAVTLPRLMWMGLRGQHRPCHRRNIGAADRRLPGDGDLAAVAQPRL